MTRHLADTNIWLALAIQGHRHHEPAVAWFDSLTGRDSVAFCRSTQQGFLRLLTNAAVMEPHGLEPLSNDRAWVTYDALLADERVLLVDREPSGLAQRWRALSSRATASTKVWMDAYLAAFAISGALSLVSNDAAFRQFDGLSLTLP